MADSHTINSVPTYLITGFLGVGKTSAVLHLLRNKPEQERWAVLVNEFGEIGIDGALLTAQSTSESGVFIREVPGGCMCCAAGVPMQVALNELLKQARPDRLLIEPTGLGHPREVLDVLTSEHYQSVLAVQRVVTLVDARKLSDERYTRHETFNQQIAIADIVVGNKVDQYLPEDRERLRAYVADRARPDTEVAFTEFGRLDLDRLNGASASSQHSHPIHHHAHEVQTSLVGEPPFPASGIIRAVNEGEGYVSQGWRFSPERLFDYERAQQLVEQVDVTRLKAVFLTNQGAVGMNKTEDGLQLTRVNRSLESRVEVIADHLDPAFENELLACLTQSKDSRS
ncbi:CobW family GTP-binding protein [Reinekea blandensis]|uniref:Cobalamin synthesis protein/P47K family protein n=1 Tax=Reinekea blandensis MED297 TaxID=314283 RepID=A4BD32_9GAMM|nr:GTP-binding protein [Reinekea blandensis]EAR10114.1 cobalamin synthesis protein/P47K family protein [Reinekea sp. MED297] [Reinekea blandensis MED297]